MQVFQESSPEPAKPSLGKAKTGLKAMGLDGTCVIGSLLRTSLWARDRNSIAIDVRTVTPLGKRSGGGEKGNAEPKPTIYVYLW
jgi:hypothetical protein